MTVISKSVLFRAASCLPALPSQRIGGRESDKKIRDNISQYSNRGPRIDWSYRGFENLLGQAYKIGEKAEVLKAIQGSKHEDESEAKGLIAAEIFKKLPPTEWELVDLKAATRLIGEGIEFHAPFDLALRQQDRMACVIFCPYSNIALYDNQREFLLQLLALPLNGYREAFELHYFEFPKNSLGKRNPKYVFRRFQYAETKEIEAHIANFQLQNSGDQRSLF